MLWRIGADGEMRLVVFMPGQQLLHRDMWPHYTDQLARHQPSPALGSLISVAVYDNSVPGLGHTGHLIFSCLISASNWSHQLLLLGQAPGVLLQFAPLSNLCIGQKHKKWRGTSTKDFILLGLAQKPGWQTWTYRNMHVMHCGYYWGQTRGLTQGRENAWRMCLPNVGVF